MDLDPAGCRGNVLPVVLGPPALHKGHPDGAHLGQLIDSLKAVTNCAAQELGKLLIREDLETATWRYFAHCSEVEIVAVIAVT